MLANTDMSSPWWWLLRGVAIFLIVGAAMPYVRTGWWAVRVWDFAQVQLAIAGTIVGTVLAALALTADPVSALDAILAGLVIIGTAGQIWMTARYTFVHAKAVPNADRPDIHILVANVDIDNPKHEETRRRLREIDPDILLLIEVDDHWLESLAPLRETYSHRLEEARPHGVGIAVWSKLRMSNDSIDHLVSEQRPSAHATMHLEDGRSFRFAGVHPTPPALPRNGDTKKRHDSRIRDAELVVIGKTCAEDGQEGKWIVAGDFNDVPWSRATRLFSRVSGLSDTRIGRATLGTYHTSMPTLRYPLDHAFVSPCFRVCSLTRERVPGSDHFALDVRLQLDEELPDGTPDTDDGDEKLAAQMHRDGREEANGDQRPAD